MIDQAVLKIGIVGLGLLFGAIIRREKMRKFLGE